MDRKWTRRDIAAQVALAASALRTLGVEKGDRVTFMRRNVSTHFVLFLACSRLGAVFVPLNFRLSPVEARDIVADCGARVAVFGPEEANNMDRWGVTLVATKGVVDDLENPVSGVDPHWMRFSRVDPSGPVAPEPGTSTSLAMLQYTSGSSGRAKGVCQTLGNIHASWNNFTAAFQPSAFQTTLAFAPFAHVGGFHSLTLQTFLSGGVVVLQRQFDVGRALMLIEREHVTSVFGVPSMYDAMSRHPAFPTTDLSSLEVALVGGASASQELLTRFKDRGVPMYHAWGMTETLGLSTVLDPRDFPMHPTSVGKECEETRVRIALPDGSEAPTGTVGEIMVHGKNVAPCYWGNIEANKDFAPDGWLHTGDLASKDAEGFIELRGRRKDLIISGGENIYPAEIERVLGTATWVKDVCVVGLENRRWGESPLAVIVPAPGAPKPTVEDVRQFLDGRLAHYKLPRYVEVLDQLPLNSSGKVDRKGIREAVAILHSPGLPWFPHYDDVAGAK